MLASFLDISRQPEKSDCIFVFAGREERKRLGVELYREGFAPRLILSVGRFEWRRFRELGLPSDGGLVAMVQTIAPEDRHFFVELSSDHTSCRWLPPGRYGTLTEARGLAAVLETRDIAKLTVVSSGEHLRRCVLSMRRFLPDDRELIPVSSGLGESAASIELFKLTGYGILSVLARLGIS